MHETCLHSSSALHPEVVDIHLLHLDQCEEVIEFGLHFTGLVFLHIAFLPHIEREEGFKVRIQMGQFFKFGIMFPSPLENRTKVHASYYGWYP